MAELVDEDTRVSYPIADALQKEHLDNSPISQYIIEYLTYFGVQCFIKEKNYIDRDYLIDYSKFYARSFQPNNRFTDRLHFFSEIITDDEVDSVWFC